MSPGGPLDARRHIRHRPLIAAIGALALAVATVAAATVADARPVPVVARTQEVATLRTSHKVFAALGAGRSTGRVLPSFAPITGGPTVLPVTRHATTRDGTKWLRVMLPGRPNGARGWITQRGTALKRTSWHLVVSTARRRVLVYRTGRLVRSFAAVVGKPATPTPQGQFFVEESIRMLPGSAGAPFALATSARSNVLQEFDGGPGQIAIHGVANLGGTPGTAVSHGCVRLANADIRWLAARISPGVPVTVTA